MKTVKHEPKFLTASGTFPFDVMERKFIKSYKATAKRKLRAFKKLKDE